MNLTLRQYHMLHAALTHYREALANHRFGGLTYWDVAHGAVPEPNEVPELARAITDQWHENDRADEHPKAHTEGLGEKEWSEVFLAELKRRAEVTIDDEEMAGCMQDWYSPTRTPYDGVSEYIFENGWEDTDE